MFLIREGLAPLLSSVTGLFSTEFDYPAAHVIGGNAVELHDFSR
jgi:hypothetical protein